ncbi:MAG: hypothetical protein NTY75_03280 [Candidatus Shapirobacteria bacterium]|nr:hypothetical protein [Candidatus Shapirobacteria bacterium]
MNIPLEEIQRYINKIDLDSAQVASLRTSLDKHLGEMLGIPSHVPETCLDCLKTNIQIRQIENRIGLCRENLLNLSKTP